MNMISSRWFVSVAALVLAGACTAADAATKQSEPDAPKKAPSARSEKEAEAGPSGTVVESMNTGGYTYVCLENAGKKTWVAVPEMKVTVGQKMSFQPGQVMPDFQSKSLNRTFDSIIFSGGVAGTGAASMPTGHPDVSGAQQGASGSKSQVSAKDKNIKVEKAAGPNSYTVAEVYAKAASLDKKTVVVKGKVVKVSQGIMGKNWVHLQDGSGDQKKGTHNLVATTQDLPAAGEVVTASGTLAKDRDFGAGYVYQVILEDAKVVK
jgi:hypothetical protein